MMQEAGASGRWVIKICKFELLHDGCMPPPTCQVAEYMHGCTDLYSTVVHEPK